MGFFDRIMRHAYYDTTREDLDARINALDGIPDDNFCTALESIWQYDYAVSVVCNLMSSVLTNVEWTTYIENKRFKGEDAYKLNYAPNDKESAAEFFAKLAYQLVTQREALIIELRGGQLFVATSYSFKDGQEQVLRNNTFIDVTVDDTGITLNRSFRENRDCIYIKMPKNPNVEAIFSAMASEYAQIKKLISTGAKKAMGMKLELRLTATAKNKYDEQYLTKMNEQYQKLMEKENALFISYNGEQLVDLTEKQRGSEVQQILELANNNITISQEILKNVGRAWGIPEDIMLEKISTENGDNLEMYMTNFVKPIIKLLGEKFSLFLLEKESILKGSRIIGNLSTVKYVDVLQNATGLDKLVGSGLYTINELREEKIGDNAVEDGDTRFITKNYASLDSYVTEETKGGEQA